MKKKDTKSKELCKKESVNKTYGRFCNAMSKRIRQNNKAN